jgi:aspartate kinase
MGASVLHEDAVFPVIDLNIPVHVRNTNMPG